MDALIEFLRARLDEDEAAARATLWEGSGNRPDWNLPASATVDVGGHEFYAEDRTVAQHIVRHDPERVLREIAAKRRIIDAYEEAVADFNDSGPALVSYDRLTGSVSSLRRAVLLLATPYADHPDYRQEWAP